MTPGRERTNTTDRAGMLTVAPLPHPAASESDCAISAAALSQITSEDRDSIRRTDLGVTLVNELKITKSPQVGLALSAW